jgi:hypothetical protein
LRVHCTMGFIVDSYALYSIFMPVYGILEATLGKKSGIPPFRNP